MCGRIALYTPPQRLARLLEASLAAGLDPDGTRRAGTSGRPRRCSASKDRGQGRVLDAYRWGLVPSWAKDPSVGSRMFNARAETVATKPSFRDAFRAPPPLGAGGRLLRVGPARHDQGAALLHARRRGADRARGALRPLARLVGPRRPVARDLHRAHDDAGARPRRHPRPDAGRRGARRARPVAHRRRRRGRRVAGAVRPVAARHAGPPPRRPEGRQRAQRQPRAHRGRAPEAARTRATRSARRAATR